MTHEERRLVESRERKAHWKRWGPYLSERAWGTVREDYSPGGTAWDYFPHDHARSRAFRWNEDGLGGISDRHQTLCFALSLWNGRDPILKERLFGLASHEGNHGEDVKELYYYLDSTPTHSYMKFLYKYPRAEFPYARLVEENARRGRGGREYELLDTGVFDDGRYFDVTVEYAKASPEDILARIEVANRGPEAAAIELLPTLWYRNTWSWDAGAVRPSLRAVADGPRAGSAVRTSHSTDGELWLGYEGHPDLLFTENETNGARLFGLPRGPRGAKDAFHELVVHGRTDAVNPDQTGTKFAARYPLTIPAGETRTIRLRLSRTPAAGPSAVGAEFEDVLTRRRREADEFYNAIIPTGRSEEERRVMRQAFAGMLWSKQFYHYVVKDWLRGDPAQPTPPAERVTGRNREWTHLHNADVISMPDKWEYPWYAAWDLAFHCIPLAQVDPDFAKEQLVLLLREWYMHPNGQLPAYEWALGDVNPPVLAWAAWRVYQLDRKRSGRGDRTFLKRVFQKLTLNFTWWVNRKDAEQRNVFQGGFLGLDNVGVFDRSKPLPTGGHLEQSDGTSWMAMYCLDMLRIALELACEEPAYEDMASKFWEHFVYISHAMNTLGLWDEKNGFYYDVLHLPDGRETPLRVRSLVGLIPLFAVETFEPELLARFPAFKKRLEWFIDRRADLIGGCACMRTPGTEQRRLFAVVDAAKLRRVLEKMLDEREFLSPFGVRSLSRVHRDWPFELAANGEVHRVEYEPGESTSGLFGGNSNWRGPIWFPVNFMLIESLRKFHAYLGDGFKVECPTGSGIQATLERVAWDLSRRVAGLFLPDASGRRPVNGDLEPYRSDPYFKDLVLFHEYFHGDDGAGLGASHQTGWTGLVATLLADAGAEMP